jgi:hypothetical protein
MATTPNLGLTIPVGGSTPGALNNTTAGTYPNIWATNLNLIDSGAYSAGNPPPAPYVSVLTYGADPTGATDSSAAFAAAFAAMGNAGTLIIPPATGGVTATYKIAANLTVPSTVSLQFSSSKISISGGYTLTVNGDVFSPQQQIFEGSGTVQLYKGVVSVRWFGAMGNGSTDDTATINTALASVYPPTATGYTAGAGRPVLFFPAGTYVVSSLLTAGSGADIRGEQAVLSCASNGIDILDLGVFRGRVDGMQFSGGRNQIVISTGNADVNDYQIVNCRFFSPYAAAIEVAANSGSSQIAVDRCMIIGLPGSSYAFNAPSGGQNGAYVTFTDCWVTCNGPTVFHNSSCNLTIRNMVGVPEAGQTWIVQDGGPSLTCDNCRFGGEAVTEPIVAWSTAASLPAGAEPVDTFLIFRGCQMYSSNGGVNMFSFTTLPNRFVCEHNTAMSGLSETLGVHYDSTIPLTSRVAIGSMLSSSFSDDWNKNVDYVGGDAEITNRAIAGDPVTVQCLESGDLVYQTIGHTTRTAVDCTATTFSDPFGLTGDQATAATNTSMNYSLTFGASSIPLYGLAAGDYTAVFHVGIQAAPLRVGLTVAGVNFFKTLELGNNLVSIPFSVNATVAAAGTWTSGATVTVGEVLWGAQTQNAWLCTNAGSGTTASTGNPDAQAAGIGETYTDANGVVWAWVCGAGLGITAQGAQLSPSPTIVQVGRTRVFKHHPKISTINTKILGTGAPASGQWYVGDQVEITDPVPSSGYIGLVCTTSGSPGTWKSFGQISG